MALRSATTTLATIQMRCGAEELFDPEQMTAGEWAVSTDSKKVWMCFRPGLVLRMATYEAFERDMEEIRRILVEAKDIQKAIETWNYLAESYAHGGTGKREGEDTDNAKYYADQAKISADNAESVSGVGIMTVDKAGIGKPDGETITVDEDGTLHGVASGDFASKAIYGDDAVSLGRKEGTVVGEKSFTFGNNLDVTGRKSMAIGDTNIVAGINSFSGGYNNKTSGNNSISFGSECNAMGYGSMALGSRLASVNDYCFSEGCGNIALGYGSHAENCQNIAGAKYVFKIGSYDAAGKKFTFDDTYTGFSDAFAALEVGSKLFVQNFYYINDALVFTVNSIESDGKSIIVEESIPSSNFNVYFATIIQASSGYNGCHVEGRKNFAAGQYAHAEGCMTEARGDSSHTEGYVTKATNNQSHAEGYSTIASGNQSHAEGYYTIASGMESHAGGMYTIANGWAQTVIGRYNNPDTDNNTNVNPFVVGNGTSESARSNAFRVHRTGSVYGKAEYNSSGADYAEFIKEWHDGNPDNEDRVGYFVTVKDGYLHKANEGDYIVGITSGNPSVVGNSDEEYYWRWERDEFNRIVYEEVEEYVEKI